MRINDKFSYDFELDYVLQKIPLRAKPILNLQQIAGIGLVNVNILTEYENFDMELTFFNKNNKLIDFIKKDNIFNNFFKDDYCVLHFDEYSDDVLYVGIIKEMLEIQEFVEDRKLVQKFNVTFSVKPYKYKFLKQDLINTITSVQQLEALVEGLDYKLIL